MPARHLAIGLDGADLGLVRRLGPRRLPNLFALMERGAFAALESVPPAATLPNWTTFLTGTDPGTHGVFDFTVRNGYRVAFAGGTAREVPTVISRLDAAGLVCACVAFPGTWPPERLHGGVFISGWDSPVAFEADRSFVWPPSLYEPLVRRFGPPRFDDVNEFDAETAGWHAALPAALQRRIAKKVALGQWLLTRQDWDLFAIYFGESDTASHYLYGLFDPDSPRHVAHAPQAARNGLSDVYGALDTAVGTLLNAAGGDHVEVTVVSDHGSGGSSDKVLYLNRALAEAGLLTFRSGPRRAATVAKELALRGLPPRARARLFRAAGAALPGWLESKARFGAIDMTRSVAFSDELNYFPAIHLNVRGREPAGTVAPHDLSKVRYEVERALCALRDPWSGEPVVAQVLPREELYRGPWLARAPDLVLELHLDQGYSYNLQPSGTAPPGVPGPWRRLKPTEYLGRKGRTLAGSHRSHGLYVAAGPQVRAAGEIRARIADATASLLFRMSAVGADQNTGRVLFELLEQEGTESQPHALPTTPGPRGPATTGDERLLAQRLRALGYVD